MMLFCGRRSFLYCLYVYATSGSEQILECRQNIPFQVNYQFPFRWGPRRLARLRNLVVDFKGRC
jgi:hypothetical protein